MFSLSIVLDSIQWRLLFKTEENAKAALLKFAATNERDVSIADDFGQLVVAKNSAVAGYLFEDLDKTKLAAVELALHDARIRAQATQNAMTDPQLRAAAGRGGPSVIQPGIGANGMMR